MKSIPFLLAISLTASMMLTVGVERSANLSAASASFCDNKNVEVFFEANTKKIRCAK